MNSHASSSCLLAVIAIFITATSVMSHIVPPPAKIAGHNSNSLTALEKDVTGITDPSTIATASPSPQNSIAFNKTLYDGANHAPKNDDNHDNVPPVVSEALADTAWCHLLFLVLNILSFCLMAITAFVYDLSEIHNHSHYLANITLGVALSHCIALFTEIIGQQTVADLKLKGITKLLFVINTQGWQLVNNIEQYNILKFMHNISKFQKEISKRSIIHVCCWYFQIISTTYCCIDIFHQVKYDEPSRLLHNPKTLGVQIHIKLSILTDSIPGLINIIVYIYFFIYNEISDYPIVEELSSLYEKRIATRDLLFKLSVIMFTVDFLYILIITMGWNFNAIHIFLRLLKSIQGILIFCVTFVRTFAPVLYDKLLKRLRRRKGSANEETLEETAKPMYTITQLITTV